MRGGIIYPDIIYVGRAASAEEVRERRVLKKRKMREEVDMVMEGLVRLFRRMRLGDD